MHYNQDQPIYSYDIMIVYENYYEFFPSHPTPPGSLFQKQVLGLYSIIRKADVINEMNTNENNTILSEIAAGRSIQ
ncbi:hypothetical protein AX774_g3022 [Zancudomyces culisetae]|uniref:Uncharacterized protein n=1 Tax=Zancudomyces culisetae TaxID=1213189 RepID=A0A1R1PR55_ZANCU|nr:hypothetical protein AX774_g3022 [Zancudomyces culisetae]|eukprot:OMH83466.1 hypothetical protein AX774_g3022 [Zancudomyces culisetae]